MDSIRAGDRYAIVINGQQKRTRLVIESVVDGQVKYHYLADKKSRTETNHGHNWTSSIEALILDGSLVKVER